MTRRFFGFFGALAGLSLMSAGCIDDPLADLDGAPAAVILSHTVLVQAIGERDTVTARVVDGRFTPLELPITFAACDGDVGLTANPAYSPVPPTSVQFIVQAVAAGASCVVVSGGGVSDTVAVGVLPVSFGGTLSSTTPQGGDTLTVASTTELKFDTATVAVTFGGGNAGVIVAKTRDQLKVLVPFSSAAPLSIAGIDVTYVPGLIATLATTSAVTQTGDRWGTGDTSYATAPAIAVPATAGSSLRMVTNFGPANNTNCAEFGPPPPNGSIGPCVIYRLTLADTTRLRLVTDWNSTADIDIYACGSAGLAACFESGGSGAGSAKPEAVNAFLYSAGTHYFVIERWSGTLPTNLVLTIARP